MFEIFKERLHQKFRTLDYPHQQPALSPRFLGRPEIAAGPCPEKCSLCQDVCPTRAISFLTGGAEDGGQAAGRTGNFADSPGRTTFTTAGENTDVPGCTAETGGIVLDMGRCLFCGECASVCPRKAIVFTDDHHVASPARAGLLVFPGKTQERGGKEILSPEENKAGRETLNMNRAVPDTQNPAGDNAPPAGKIQKSGNAASHTPRDLSLFGRSLKFRQVSAGGCGACEADCNVLGTPVYDMAHFGLDFVASPRHADGLVVTGPVTANMRAALLDTYSALPEPKIVIAAGSCACSGGLFAEDSECCAPLDSLIPVDIYIPGCPPNPWSILDGMLRVAWYKKHNIQNPE